jgi:hypothetical protein
LTWSGARPGTGQLKVFEPSARDGKPVNVVTIPVIVTP